MRTAIILHGRPSKEEYFDQTFPSPSNSHWLPWLQRQLIINGIFAETPELPVPYEPDYEAWCSVFNRFSVDDETDLIGHSAGAGFLLRWLSENKIKLGKLVLVAPFLDPEKTIKSGMLDFKIDKRLFERAEEIVILVSPDDDADILESAEQIKSELPSVKAIELPGRGHFTMEDMGTEEFPELLDILLPESMQKD